MNNILFINACVRPESRTIKIANHLLNDLSGNITILDLASENIAPLNNITLLEREQALKNQDANSDLLKYARQFAAADEIVIAAPYWDLSFPALLRNYIEAVSITGVTFAYSESGEPYGLCKAKNLYYVTTAGGPIISDAYGYGYIKTLCKTFYGIENTFLIKAEGLDIIGADVDSILSESMNSADTLLK